MLGQLARWPYPFCGLEPTVIDRQESGPVGMIARRELISQSGGKARYDRHAVGRMRRWPVGSQKIRHRKKVIM